MVFLCPFLFFSAAGFTCLPGLAPKLRYCARFSFASGHTFRVQPKTGSFLAVAWWCVKFFKERFAF